MPKAIKSKRSNERRDFYSLHPWQVRVIEDRAELTAYTEASGEWETVLTVHPTSGASAETLAAYIAVIINAHHCKTDLLREAMEALELCLEEDHLTFSSEQEADRVVARIKRSIR